MRPQHRPARAGSREQGQDYESTWAICKRMFAGSLMQNNHWVAYGLAMSSVAATNVFFKKGR